MAYIETGVTTQQAIWDKSPYLQYYIRSDARGRKPIISNEQMDYSRDNLIGLTMVDKSVFILLPTYFPEIYMLHSNPNLRKAIKGCINYICETATDVSGIADTQLNTINVDFKTQFFNIPIITNMTGNTTEIEITVPTDLAGYFITEQIRHWQNAISDEYSKSATYNGVDLEFNNWSHSCGMAYIKPNKTWNRVDYGALFFCMIPTSSGGMQHFNANSQDSAAAALSLKFTVSMMDTRNYKVRELLNEILARYRETVVRDSGIYGSTGTGTFMGMFDDIDPDRTIRNLTEYE